MSNIEWTEKTWNPITGCTKISEGCLNCYAERMAKRLAGRFGYNATSPFQPTLHMDKFYAPMIRKKPTFYFVCSMGDLFHNDVSKYNIKRVIERARLSRQHTYMFLTKRPERMKFIVDKMWNKPPPNIWLGVTAENQKRADERIPILLDIPAAVHFVSVEPMLSRIDIDDHLHGLEWIIAGCESGSGRRPAQIEWFRGLKNQCTDTVVPFFFETDGY